MRGLRAVRVTLLVGFGVLASVTKPMPARADAARVPTKTECANADADGQAMRLDGKFAAARAQFETCQTPSCPAIVRDDCAQRLDELDKSQPTIVFDVKDAAGSDASVTSVTADGEPIAGRVSGGALRVDPGEHDFVIAPAGRPPVRRHLVLKEGEKNRRELIVLEAAPPPVSAVPTPVEPLSAGLGTRRWIALATGGAGIGAVALGAVFGALTFSAVSRQNTDCASATSCANPTQAASDHSASVTDGTVSTVAFVAGGLLIAGGVALYVTAPKAAPREAAWLRVAPTAGPGGAGLAIGGGF